MSKKKDKKTTTEQYLYSIDMANREVDSTLKLLVDKSDRHLRDLSAEVNALRDEISRLNSTIYEDRRVLADFVAKFFKDTKTVLNPKLAIDGGKKAKSK